MKKYSLFFVGIVCMIFASCTMGNKVTSEEGTVTINIGNQARTIVPLEWNITEVSQWEITFDNTEEGISDSSITTTDITSSFTIPVGIYNISITGSGTNEDELSFTVFGKTKEPVNITSGENSSVTIFVELKKTEEGTGDFEYTITFKNSDFITAGEYGKRFDSTNFYAYLTKVGSNSPNYLNTKKITVEGGSPKLKISNKKLDEENDSYINIFSGYYYLTVEYKYGTGNTVLSLDDSLIEIADGLTSTGEYEDSATQGIINKTFYADNFADHKTNNGLTPYYRKEFNSIIEWLDENQDEWTNANIYFYDINSYGEGNLMTQLNSAPIYNVDVNPTSNDQYAKGFNKEITVYAGSTQQYIYSLRNGKIYFLDYLSDCSMNFESSETEAPVIEIRDFSSSSPRFSNSTKLTLFLDNVNVNFTIMGVTTPYLNVYTTKLAPYTDSDSTPLVQFDNTVSDENMNFKAFIQNDSGDITYKGKKYTSEAGKYTMFAARTSGSSSTKFYTALAGSSGVAISGYFPAYSITGDANPIYHTDADVFTYTVAPTSQYDTFETGTTYKWFLNGNELTDETSSTVNINPTTNTSIQSGSNNLMVLLSYNDEYTSNYFEFTPKYIPAADTSVLLYDSSNNWNLFKPEAVTDTTELVDPFTDLKGFTFDAYGNLYIMTSSTGTASYNGATGGLNIVRYKTQDGVLSGSGVMLYTTVCDKALITCDTNNNVLYIMDCLNYGDTSKNTQVIKIEDPQNITEFISSSNMTSSVDATKDIKIYEFNGYPYFPTHFVVSNDMLYMYDTSDNLRRALLTVNSNKYELQILTHLKGIDGLIFNVSVNGTYSALNSLLSDGKISVSDMIIADNYLYILVSNNGGRNIPSTSPSYQRGGILKIKTDDTFDTSATTDKMLSMISWTSGTDILGWNNTSSNYSGYESGENVNLTISQGSATDSDKSVQYLVGPGKFVAIKPKKIIFTDHGWIVKENGSTVEPKSEIKLSNINRVVTFDLETKTMTATDLSKVEIGENVSTSTGYTVVTE